ncbi:hypothetical protein ACFX2A_009119 [Malus domestica]
MNRLLGTFPDCYLALLSSSHLQLLLELDLKSPTSQNNWYDIGFFTLKLPSMDESPRSDGPSKAKGCRPLLLGKRLKLNNQR